MVNEVNSVSTPASDETRAKIEEERRAILQNVEALNQKRRATKEAAEADKNAATKTKSVSAEESKKQSALKQSISLLTQMQDSVKNWTAAANGKSSADYGAIKNYIVQLRDFQAQLENGEISVDEFNAKLKEIRTGYAEASQNIKGFDENTKTFAGHMGSLASKFTSWLTVSQAVSYTHLDVYKRQIFPCRTAPAYQGCL